MKLKLTLFLIMLTNTTYAFEISPQSKIFKGKEIGTEAVHEHITYDAIKMYNENCKKLNTSSDCLENYLNLKSGRNSFIRGNWWADDPNQRLYKFSYLYFLGYMMDGRRRVNNQVIVDHTYRLHYRGHFGDMQFMHAMTSPNESTEDTRNNILMWIEFLYKVSIGEYKRETKFSSIKINGLDRYFSRHQDWEIQWLLQPKWRLSDPNDFKYHALGALLHTLQDSYSKSHTMRTRFPTAACPYGRILGFYNYKEQTSSSHGVYDSRKAYENSIFDVTSNPVSASAKLIEFSINKADWNTEVKPYLTKVVFCIHDTC